MPSIVYSPSASDLMLAAFINTNGTVGKSLQESMYTYFSANSGLPASASLADHRLAYYNLALGANYTNLTDAEIAWMIAKEPTSVNFPDLDSMRWNFWTNHSTVPGLAPPPGTPLAWFENPASTANPPGGAGTTTWLGMIINPAAGGINGIVGINLKFANPVTNATITAIIAAGGSLSGTAPNAYSPFTANAHGSQSGLHAAAGGYAKVPFAGSFNLAQFTNYTLLLTGSTSDIGNLYYGGTATSWTKSSNFQGSGLQGATSPNATTNFSTGGSTPTIDGVDFQLTST